MNRREVVILLEELLYNKDKLNTMRNKALALAKPDSAVDIGRCIMELIRR